MKNCFLIVVAAMVYTGCDTAPTQSFTGKTNPDSLLAPVQALIDSGNYAQARIMASTLRMHYSKTKLDTLLNGMMAQIDSAEVETKRKKESLVKKLKTAMRKEVDDIKGTTWYYATLSPKYSNRNSFYIYIGEQKDKVWLRLKIQYAADDWLFIQKYTIKADDDLYTVVPINTVSRDNNYGGIWETCDESVARPYYEMLKKVCSAKVVKLRCEGQQYYRDRILTSAEKQGISQVFSLFEAMGGVVQ